MLEKYDIEVGIIGKGFGADWMKTLTYIFINTNIFKFGTLVLIILINFIQGISKKIIEFY